MGFKFQTKLTNTNSNNPSLNPGQRSMDHGHNNLICSKIHHCNEILTKNYYFKSRRVKFTYNKKGVV